MIIYEHYSHQSVHTVTVNILSTCKSAVHIFKIVDNFIYSAKGQRQSLMFCVKFSIHSHWTCSCKLLMWLNNHDSSGSREWCGQLKWSFCQTTKIVPLLVTPSPQLPCCGLTTFLWEGGALHTYITPHHTKFLLIKLRWY